MRPLFPLRLGAFEEFMFLDDRPGYRMTFLIDQTFEGEIDRAAFDAGVEEAGLRHPLLNSLVKRRRFLRWHWVPVNGMRPRVDWGTWEQPLNFPEECGIDLRREVGVRFFVRAGNGKSRLVTQFHHACCDGYGAIQFLADLFTTYTRRVDPRAAAQLEYQPTRTETLARRDELRVHTEREMIWFRLFLRTLADYGKYAVHAPQPLARPRVSSGGTPLAYPGTLTNTLSEDVQRALKKIARRSDVTVNELLACELMRTICAWNERHGNVRETDQISVILPTNMRNLEHDSIPAANVIGLVTFQRPVSLIRNPQQLLESIREESRFYKRWRFAAAFLDGVKVVRVVPGLLRLILNRKASAGSAIFSCIGDPSRVLAARYPVNEDGHPVVGNLVFTDVNSAPTIRPHTHAAFTTWHFHDKLRLGVRCDPAVFTQESARELLDLYAGHVSNLAATLPARSAPERVAA